MTCHGSGGTAPQVVTHSDVVINGSSGWAVACLDCHDPHFHDQLMNLSNTYLVIGIIDAYSNNGNGSSTITFTYSSATVKDGWNLPPHGDNADWSDKTGMGRGLILIADTASPDETFEIISAVRGTPDQIAINGVISGSPVGNTFGIIYGQLLKAEIYTETFIAGTGNTSIKFYESSGENSFADGVDPHDGICQVCHENTNHFTRAGDVNAVSPGPGVMDHTDNAGTNCAGTCHTHTSGFGLGGGDSCGTCHENWGSHPAHIDADYGPKLACYDCHNTNNYPLFVDDQNLTNTTVCDTCHSAGGAYNGVDSTGDSVGAKDNWISGVYDGDINLQSGKEKWCVGCHDDDEVEPSVIQGVTAPNMAGDDLDYGYYKTGHGKHGNGQAIGCLDCHDASVTHTDGEARTYTAATDNYQAGYRLKDIDGQAPMDIPRASGLATSQFRLCFSCHSSFPFLTMDNTDTNFRKDVNDDCVTPPAQEYVNKHWYHLQSVGAFKNDWDSDWDGTTGDSLPSCPACHNVHGAKTKAGATNAPAMIRTGELIGRSSALNLQYFENPCDDQTLSETNETANSAGGAFTGGGTRTISGNGVCIMCHTVYMPYWREAKGVTGCENCHGHDAGYEYESGKFSAGRGTFQSHSTHTENDTDDLKGPHIDCDDCHDINNIPYFKSGSGGDGPPWDLTETDVCDTCHSPGGTYDGLIDPAVGAKIIWHTGAYAATDDSTLAAGKEKWCVSCHDEEPSEIAAIPAPNIAGGESETYNYGIGWGYYKTGHGLAAGQTYPNSGGTVSGANRKCDDCHDLTTKHIDGVARTYDPTAITGNDNDYQHGYRLISVAGQPPMQIPRIDGCSPPAPVEVADFRLCFSCHDSEPFTDPGNTATNFRHTGTPDFNAHYYHLAIQDDCDKGPIYATKWNGSWDSRASCVTCHNVHGSTQLSMVRDGRLVGKEPGPEMVYYNPVVSFECGGPSPYDPTPTDTTLPDSTGTVWHEQALNDVGFCDNCHGSCGYDTVYYRTPFDRVAPYITKVYGKEGSDTLSVQFSERVYAEAGATGDLAAVDFTFTDLDDGRSVLSVTHTAGENAARLTLSSALDGLDDIDVDTVSAASDTSIYDINSLAMSTTAVTIEGGDEDPPSVSNRNPINGATDIAVSSNVSFTLADSLSGVDWSTLTVQLSGDKGYSENYTGASPAVSRTGNFLNYDITVDTGANFGFGEVITVTVNANDMVGNVMTAAVWSFTTLGGGGPFIEVLHPSGVASAGGFSTFDISPGGTGDWADILDTDDGDLSYAYFCCSAPGQIFYVDIDDFGIADPSIQSIIFHVYARYEDPGGGFLPVAGDIDIGYTTNGSVDDGDTVWNGNISLDATGNYNLVSSIEYTEKSDGGALELADVNNLRIAVKRNGSGSPQLQVTEIYVEVKYGVVSGDTEPPTISNLNPANGVTDVPIGGNLSFTLADNEGGVDWSTFEIQLSGNKGYSKIYTDLDVSVVSKSGNMAGYDVLVNPDANFSNEETITVTVNVDDRAGNPLTPPTWSFSTEAVSTPQTTTIYPSAYYDTGGYSTYDGVNDPTWSFVLDDNDWDVDGVYWASGGAAPQVFYVDMDDPAGLGDATIQKLTFHVYAKYVSIGGGAFDSRPEISGDIDIGFRTGTGAATLWRDTYTTTVDNIYDLVSSVEYAADSDGGPLDLSDINNMQIAVKRLTSGGNQLRVTQVYVEVNYLP